jgi:hypothetical protein
MVNRFLIGTMNRLSPLIVRRVGPTAAALPLEELDFPPSGPPEWLDDLRFFATGWVAGLVVFGTLLS